MVYCLSINVNTEIEKDINFCKRVMESVIAKTKQLTN